MSDENTTPTTDPHPAEPAAAEAPSAASAAEPQAAERVAEPLAPPAVTEADAEEQPTPHHAPAAVSSAVVAHAEPVAEEAAAEPEAAPPAPESKKKWYVVKVTSNREDSIKAAVERRVRIEGLEEYFGQIAIPVEHITEVKKTTEKKSSGEKVTKEKRVVKARKKYPGYLFAEVEFNDRILYLFRETSGVGDFVGAGLNRAPVPMTDREVQAMLHGITEPGDPRKGPKVKHKLEFEKGDKVRIREGAFANMEGEVKVITEPKDKDESPKVTVEVTIFGRGVPVELDYWQVDKV